MRYSKQDVVDSLRAAWAEAEYPGDHAVRGGDDGTDIAADFRGRHWHEIAGTAIRFHALLGNLLHMKGDVFRFYLPAFLLAALDDPEVIDHTTWTLTHLSNLAYLDHGRQLTESQRHAIGRWWAYFRERPDEMSRTDVEEGIAAWAPYVPAPA